jgi:hypothetical protein
LSCGGIRTGYGVTTQSLISSVADPDPGSEIRDPMLFYPLDPGGIFSGSRILDPRGMFFGEIFLRILVL